MNDSICHAAETKRLTGLGATVVGGVEFPYRLRWLSTRTLYRRERNYSTKVQNSSTAKAPARPTTSSLTGRRAW